MISMQLKVTNIPAKIGINKHDAVLAIRQPRGELEITTTPTDLNMKTEHVQVRIDQSQCFSEAGLKDIFELTEDFARMGKEAVLEGIANRVAEGNRMAMIENKVNVIAQIDMEKALPEPVETNIDFIPKSRPRIDFVGGVSFNPQMGKVDIKAKINSPEINATPPSMEFYLLQHPEFHFEFVGNNVDIKG